LPTRKTQEGGAMFSVQERVADGSSQRKVRPGLAFILNGLVIGVLYAIYEWDVV
jgi:hypothetical protein